MTTDSTSIAYIILFMTTYFPMALGGVTCSVLLISILTRSFRRT